MPYPTSYRYAKSHEWVEVSGSTASLGITDYAQHSLGDIVFVELPKAGDRVEAGKAFGSIESVKSVSDLISPVTGTVTEINESLTSAPESINTDANSTWMVRVELANAVEANGLLDAAAYEAYTSEETGH